MKSKTSLYTQKINSVSAVLPGQTTTLKHNVHRSKIWRELQIGTFDLWNSVTRLNSVSRPRSPVVLKDDRFQLLPRNSGGARLERFSWNVSNVFVHVKILRRVRHRNNRRPRNELLCTVWHAIPGWKNKNHQKKKIRYAISLRFTFLESQESQTHEFTLR